MFRPTRASAARQCAPIVRDRAQAKAGRMWPAVAAEREAAFRLQRVRRSSRCGAVPVAPTRLQRWSLRHGSREAPGMRGERAILPAASRRLPPPADREWTTMHADPPMASLPTLDFTLFSTYTYHIFKWLATAPLPTARFENG